VDLGLESSTTEKFLQDLSGEVAGVPVNNKAAWSWASKYDRTGVTLYNIVRTNKKSPYHVHWPIVALASPGRDYPPQRMAIDSYTHDGLYARLAGVPYMTDYSKLSFDFLLANGYGGLAYTYYGNGVYRLSTNGILFFVPYFSRNFPYYSAGFHGELWISKSYLRRIVGQAQPLPC
jgi:hypothetical protein